MMKVNEIFESLQGEGFYTGLPVLFIRFSGCNLNCSFCDTDHSVGMEISEDKMIQEIFFSNKKVIVLTGGEPTLQITDSFLEKIKIQGKNIHIESNGQNKFQSSWLNLLDWVTISPKTKNFKQREGNELKLIYKNQSREELLELLNTTKFNYYFLQPMYLKEKGEMNIKETVEMVMTMEGSWRLSLQTHKIIGVK